MSTGKKRNKKKTSIIMDKIVNINKSLVSLKSMKLESPEISDGTPLTPHMVASYQVNVFDDHAVNLAVSISAGFKPSAIVNIDFEYTLNLEFSECIERTDFEEQIDSVLSLLGPDVTLMVGLISERMFTSPLIIPPFVEIKRI